MIGQTVSHYRITRQLGAGGMGVVYEAFDKKLDRPVALKFLSPESTRDPDAKTRFIHEAKAAAALVHPNICTIHEIDEFEGQSFIAMECCEGETLKERIAQGPLKLEEAINITQQVALGLAKAHEQDIIHRDIKPANIFLTSDGLVEILDFGLAKLSTQTMLTKTGTTLGTAGYMSPEQARGEVVDNRTDLWCLGVVFYEMVTGGVPFKGENDPALLYAIVNMRHESLTRIDSGIPLEVELLVDRLLEKEPKKRYRSADELVKDLEGLRESLDLLPRRSQLQLKLLRQRRRIAWTTVAAVIAIAVLAIGIRTFTGRGFRIDSIAVLPFENLTGDSEEAPLVEGIAMELTSTLGRVSGFKKVMPYRSMKLYKGMDKPIGDIAERVDVKALIAGTISREGTRNKVIIEMIEGSSERLLWTQVFEVERNELKGMMDDIVSGILARAGIGFTLEDEVSIAKSRSDNPDAQMAYLRGRALALSWSDENLLRGIEMLEHAVQLDSMFALAYVELSSAYSSYGMMYTSGREEYPKARNAALRALEIDDGLADAHMALGVMQATFEWDWAGAERSWRRALELGPGNADVHRGYAEFLAFMTRFEEAVEEAQKAIDLDPLTLVNQQTLGWIYYHAGRFDESIAQFEKTLVLLEEFPNSAKEMQIRRQLIWNYMAKGMHETALALIEAWDERWGDPSGSSNCDVDRAGIYIAMGRGDEVQELIDDILSREIVIPWIAEALGERELAFRMLEKLYEEKNTFMVFTKMAIELEGLRSDPRYDDLIRRLNFPE